MCVKRLCTINDPHIELHHIIIISIKNMQLQNNEKKIRTEHMSRVAIEFIQSYLRFIQHISEVKFYN